MSQCSPQQPFKLDPTSPELVCDTCSYRFSVLNMANPWAAVKPTGAWASQVEDEEAAQGGALGAPEEAFPDLSMAATKKESKRDKKKKQTVSLAEFQTGKKAYQAPKRGPAKEEIVLPSGPRAREDDDDGNSRGGLGGAFAGGRDYKDRGKLLSRFYLATTYAIVVL